MFVHLCHQSIRSGTLLVLKDDVGVVVRHEISEPGIVPGNTTLAEPASRQRVFANVGYMLLKHQRRKFSQTWTSSATSAWSTSQDEGTVVQYRQPEAKYQQEHLKQRGCRASPPNCAVMARLKAATTMMMVHHNHVALPRGRPCSVTASSCTSFTNTWMDTTEFSPPPPPAILLLHN